MLSSSQSASSPARPGSTTDRVEKPNKRLAVSFYQAVSALHRGAANPSTRQLFGPAFSQDSVTLALSIAFTHFDPWTEMPCEPHLSLSLITGKLTSNPPITCPSLLVSPGPPCHGLVSLHATGGTCVPPHCRPTTESPERAKPHRPL